MPVLSYHVAGLAASVSAYTFADTQTIAATGTHTHTVIFLHGTCGTGSDVIVNFQEGEIMHRPGIKYIAPSAPLQYNERDQMTCNSWFGTKNIGSDQWFLLFLELATFNHCAAFRRIGEISAYQTELI
jgi:predicted esterase